MAWQDDLQPASWRGVPFYVDTADLRLGRNTVIHPYPFRETEQVWVEDLGGAPFAFRITGFLIGEDVAAQQTEMLNAMYESGQGELVHPMIGSTTGSVVGGCSFVMRRDRGRYIEMSFEFVENSEDAPYPATTPDTQGQTQASAQTAQSAVAADYMRRTGSTTPSALADAPGPGHA